MFSRDSVVWLIAFMATILGYLSTKETDPRFWSYMDWINFLMFVLAWLSGKMATSPRPGENDPKSLKGNYRGDR